MPDDPEFSVESMMIEREMDQQLKIRIIQAIENLTPRQREVIFLRFYEGMSYENVATVLDITTKATYKIVARALVHLKELLVRCPLIFLSVILDIWYY
jgi:RNA polymerase sigma factor (sigma-70 family)